MNPTTDGDPMALPQPNPPILDLGVPSPWTGVFQALGHHSAGREAQELLDLLSREEKPRERARRVGEAFRKLEVDIAADVIAAAGRSVLAGETGGLRVLLSFLEVKRPGVEVLRQLESLSSLERVWLRVLSGTWREPEESVDAGPTGAIQDILEESCRVGALGSGVENLPPTPLIVRPVLAQLRKWCREVRAVLARGETLPETRIHYLTQLGMTEIHLLEKRVSLLAAAIDPYDTRWMARLLPILSRFDQDVEHMKSVVSRLATYKPFHERSLSIEHVISTGEVTKLVRALEGDPGTRGLARVISLMREAPVLDRQFAHLVAAVHGTALLRAESRKEPAPVLLETLLRVLEQPSGAPMQIRLESETAQALWSRLREMGLVLVAPGILQVPERESGGSELVLPDGCPRLPEAEGKNNQEMSLRQLLSSQIHNDQFVLGILENQKAVAMPGIVELVASRSRSLRVLDKICRVRNLHTGLVNKKVPAVLIQNPAPIPTRSLRRFIHVRFISKVDLRQIARNPAGLRSEVHRELVGYLKTLEK